MKKCRIQKEVLFLTKQEVEILRLRLKEVTGEIWTYKEIGDELGISAERVRQVYNSTREKLRAPRYETFCLKEYKT